MPSPGPAKMMPASAGAPKVVRRARHQPEANTNTSALAMPARKRHSGQAASQPSAIASVNSTVATSPARAARVGASGVGRCKRRQIHGWAAQSMAPIQYPR